MEAEPSNAKKGRRKNYSRPDPFEQYGFPRPNKTFIQQATRDQLYDLCCDWIPLIGDPITQTSWKFSCMAGSKPWNKLLMQSTLRTMFGYPQLPDRLPPALRNKSARKAALSKAGVRPRNSLGVFIKSNKKCDSKEFLDKIRSAALSKIYASSFQLQALPQSHSLISSGADSSPDAKVIQQATSQFHPEHEQAPPPSKANIVSMSRFDPCRLLFKKASNPRGG
jgi:hypothetical protein